MTKTDSANPLSGDVLLVFIPGPERTEWVRRVKEEHPGLEIRWADAFDEHGNFRTAEDLPSSTWEGLTMISTYLPPPAHLMPKVRYVQLPSAGADKWPGHPTYEDKNVVFCTANGIHAPQIANWVMSAWLSHEHHLMHYAAQMKTGTWDKPNHLDVNDSPGMRMGILGYGAIGRQCARLATAMGMEVYAYTRNPRPTAESRRDDSYVVPGTGDPAGSLPARWFHGADRASVDAFLGQDLDVLVVSLPLTAETRHLLGPAQFAILGRHRRTFVANLARGGHVDQAALVAALEAGQVRGAALDVADPEPLPPDHPLWRAPNLLITPHVSWKSRRCFDRLLDILELNLRNMAAGKPLINLVNRQLHY
ncbi:D-isomer specific 2-hydroxyacid dehydrogenase [Xylariomycetidae sp. FL0641]|nr:D-isomer specific 2-hydroxyacid dehydrogenase [Xylariomycetidae sp. FL0641]